MQAPVALRTSDDKFTPRWVDVPAPSLALATQSRSPGYTAGTRLPGSYEVAYCLSDEAWAISPVSASVTINPTVSDWDIVGTTPDVPLWTRATGVLWVYRQVGTSTWKVLGADVNRPHTWQAAKPFKAISCREHAFGGQWLYFTQTYPTLDDANYYPASAVLTSAPPAPAVRLLQCPNDAYEIAYSWACNQGETALSPITAVPAVANIPATQHAPIVLLRVLANGNPPQGALGYYLYMRKPGQQWHRQPCPDGLTGDLWAWDVVMPWCNQFVESGIQPGPVIGKSYLCSLHLALRDWNRDIIVDSDQVICCPLISEWNGATWSYQPRNHWIASFQLNEPGTWRLTVDGVQSGPMPRTNNINGGWSQWQPVLDAAFGAGNVKISDYWALFAPKIELTGKWAGMDMTGKISIQIADTANNDLPSAILAEQVGRGWIMSNADTKFKRKIATSNAGNWKVQDAATTPDGVTGYPMGWPLWVEFSQRTKLVGCDFTLMQSNCGIATADNNGGGCFHFNPVECSVGKDPSNTRAVTYGFRCIGSSSWGNGGHLCSELIMEKVHLQGKFPLVCEGNQAANWQIRDGNFHGDGSFDSAIITQTNAGAMTCSGRFTCDNARTLWASPWSQKLTIDNIWIDGGMPTLANHSANSWGKLTINGGKINQWADWLHAIESPAGSVEPYVQKLVTDNLDTQSNGAVQAKLCNPKPGQAVYVPRTTSEIPSLLQSLLP